MPRIANNLSFGRFKNGPNKMGMIRVWRLKVNNKYLLLNKYLFQSNKVAINRLI